MSHQSIKSKVLKIHLAKIKKGKQNVIDILGGENINTNNAQWKPVKAERQNETKKEEKLIKMSEVETIAINPTVRHF